MSRYQKILIFVLSLVAAGIFLFFNFYSGNSQIGSSASESTSTNDKTSKDANPITEVIEDTKDTIKSTLASNFPYTMKAMMEKEYDGRDLKLGKVLEDNKDYTRYYITYMSGELKISGILNVPKGEGPFPVLILNHGYIDPVIYTNGRGLKREQDYLAKEGYVVLHPDYRNHADSDKDPDNDISMRVGYVEDVINAVYSVKNSDFKFMDKENIGMLGHSMGGGIAINVMVIRPELVKAYGLFAPMSADQRENYEQFTKKRPEIARLVEKVVGTPEKNPEFWNSISASTYLPLAQSPVMLHHGTADKSVPFSWSETLVEKLKSNNKTITFYSYPGEGHEFSTAWPTVMQRTVEFMDENLKK